MQHLARQVHADDFREFDVIFAMDASNLRNLKGLCPEPKYLEKLHLLSDYASTIKATEVPDPYYGEAKDFEFVLDLLEDCVEKVAQKFGRR